MEIYSTALGLALATTLTATVAVAVLLIGGQSFDERARLRIRRVAQAAILLGSTLLVIALVVHRWRDHRPGSAQAMRGAEFVLEHPAPFALAAVAGLVLWQLRRSLPRD